MYMYILLPVHFWNYEKLVTPYFADSSHSLADRSASRPGGNVYRNLNQNLSIQISAKDKRTVRQ